MYYLLKYIFLGHASSLHSFQTDAEMRLGLLGALGLSNCDFLPRAAACKIQICLRKLLWRWTWFALSERHASANNKTSATAAELNSSSNLLVSSTAAFGGGSMKQR